MTNHQGDDYFHLTKRFRNGLIDFAMWFVALVSPGF